MSEDEASIGVNERTWRVSADLYAPMAASGMIPKVGTQLRFESRLIPRVVAYPEITVALRPPSMREGVPDLPIGWERLLLVADVPGSSDTGDALQQVVPLFEKILDPLSFELGAALQLGQLEILDVTAPAVIGDDREHMIFSAPPFGRNARSVDMQCIRGAMTSTLPDALPELDARSAAALRWFDKSLTTDLLHDQFIFMWISLEILCDLSTVSVQAPYQARCGHTIENCPECGGSTLKEVRGQTIKQFLATEFGVDADTSKALWNMRQMMHGAINFDSVKLEKLPELVQPLRAAVAAGIKTRLGKNPDQAPVVAPSGLSVHPSMGLGGTRKLSAMDLQPLTAVEQ